MQAASRRNVIHCLLMLPLAVSLLGARAAKVTISYDEKSVRIRYLSSEKLGYEIKDDGLPYIHPNYLNWVKNMKADIFRGLNFPIVE